MAVLITLSSLMVRCRRSVPSVLKSEMPSKAAVKTGFLESELTPFRVSKVGVPGPPTSPDSRTAFRSST